METISEQVPPGPPRADARCPHHCGQDDLPSRGLETGVVPLDLLQRGDETGVMAVGDARPTEHTSGQLSILKINCGNSQKLVICTCPYSMSRYTSMHRLATTLCRAVQAKCSHTLDFPIPMNYTVVKVVFQNEQRRHGETYP